ncbi:MAG: tRNA-queuosine alpha-mannosyltransferase domain-containing protein [Desulforhopalus sp.]
MMPRILILEPYFGGSHKHFLDGLQKHIAADYTLFSLPARKWKMRMQLSAAWFVDRLWALPAAERHFDAVLCSSFVDVAVFRALLFRLRGWNHRAQILTYFHENQFDYPLRFADSGRNQFTSINVHSALASDRIAFNSRHNRDTFIRGCKRVLKKVTDMELPNLLSSIVDRSRILYPGIDFTEIDRQSWKKSVQTPVIVWNHRWEYDKDPASFLRALRKLNAQNIDYRLILLNHSSGNNPPCFTAIDKSIQGKVIFRGYAKTSTQYAKLLSQGDIVVSTARHEFYGIAVIEAIRAGCLPLLPNRLSYPELFAKRFLYDEESLAASLEQCISRGNRLGRNVALKMTERFAWQRVGAKFADWLFDGQDGRQRQAVLRQEELR